MAKKSKNSKLLVHYTRTMTPENLSRAANYVGGYVLRGLGALGKIFTSPLTGGPQGPATVVLPKTKKLLDAERKLKETQEELIGKAMTWVSPLNYGAALATGNGLNAKKGEEEVASWSPSWQAVGRLGELYAGPKIVKGVTPRTIINTAAKAGVKPAKAALVAREIKLATGGSSKITVPDVYKSLTEAAKYKGSKGYRELVHRAQKEAEEMGLSFSPDLYIELNKHLPSIKLNSRPEGKLGGYRRSTNTIELDPDLLSPIEGKYVPFHEGLHWLKVGTPEMNSPLYNRWKENMQNDLAWGEFYRSKEYKNLALRDNAEAYARKKVKEALYEDADPYLSIPGELLANGLEAGRAIGLEPFAEYPGYGKALEAAEKARNYNKWLHDVKAGTTLEMLNFWKILTGNYLPAASIPLTTGYTLYNLFNQPKQQLQYLKQGGKMNKIRKMQTAAGGPITYEEDWSDKLEPWAAGVGLAGDAVGLGTAATGVGIPVGTAIAGFANVPNLFIDGYQTIRDAWRSYKDNGASLGSTAWNGGEFILDALGLKALQYINRAAKAGVASEKYLTSTEKALDSKPWKRVGTGHGRVRARQSANHKRKYNAKRNKALEESNVELAKRGVRPALGLYYQQKLTDEMAKRGYGVAVNDAIRSANRTVRLNLGAISGVSGGTNIYHLLPKHKSGGLIRKMLTASGGPIKLYDTLWVDNWRNRLTSPTVVAKQLAELTSKIPIKYLGGNKDNARKEFWKQEPVFQHAVDSIANQYGISPESLKYRLDREGFTDYNIKRRNTKIKKGHQQFEPRGYKLLNNSLYKLAGTQIGLDDAKTYIDSGEVKLINEKWFDLGTFKNEKGRITYPVEPATLNDGMGIVAAHLKYFRDKALLDFPNASEYDLDRYANAYYNRGALGGKKWVLAGAKGYNYRKQGGKMNILEFLKNGSGIHIKKKNRGKFTSYCGGKVTDECILKGKNSSNPAIRKRATFAANARKWKHKDGGIIKADTGTKINWNSILNTGINTGINYIGQMLLGGGSSSSDNTLSSNNNYADAMTNTAVLNILGLLKKIPAKLLSTMFSSDPYNANADGGGIVTGVKNYYANKDFTDQQRQLLESQKLIDKLNELDRKNKYINTALDLAQQGFGIALNYAGKNKKGSSVS